jgi:hypothetical protein
MSFSCNADTTDARANVTHPASSSAYLVGLSTFQQQPLLGTYEQGLLCLSDCGLIVADEWVRSATNRKGIELDAWTLTPTSLQSIVFLPTRGAAEQTPKPWLLSSFIASFKAAAAKRINLRLNQLGQSVWQRNYQEVLITDPAQLEQLRHRLQIPIG